MPIRIPVDLPAKEVLDSENIFAMDLQRASTQDIRPMEVGLLNLMPNKIETEIQILRMLSNTPLQINIDLIRIDDLASKNTPETHLNSFYHNFSDIKEKRYDGLIITGAPLGCYAYEEVKYWPEMLDIFAWSKRNVQSTMFLCWAAHAAMYAFHGAPRKLMANKLSGVFAQHNLLDTDELMRGFDPIFYAPHSRFGYVEDDAYRQAGLNILAAHEQTGVFLAATENKRQVYVTGHPEYDPETLKNEYLRDLARGEQPSIPSNYFVNDDPEADLLVRWKSTGHLLFTNWLNYYVYQTTPYDLTQLADD